MLALALSSFLQSVAKLNKNEVNKMDEETNEKKEFTPEKPAYKGIVNVPVWRNKDKNGNEYLSMKIFGTTVNLFPAK